MEIPQFNDFGLLPPGDYPLTPSQLRRSRLVLRDKDAAESWDESWRLKLVNNLAILADQLWQVGITDIFVNGSFVEDKNHPSDIDGYFACDLTYFITGQLQRDLNKIDPHKVWTWSPTSRTASSNSTKRQLPMWHFYRVELYPHFDQLSGIVDEFGNNLQFPAAFRKSRSEHRQKGIVRLLQEQT